MADEKQQALRNLPGITDLLKTPQAAQWLQHHPPTLVTTALREAVTQVRQSLLAGQDSMEPAQCVEVVLKTAERILTSTSRNRVRKAINATGIILHTGLGRAVLPGLVVDSLVEDLKGCCTLAIDPETGERAERDELIEPILCELTGAEAATVVNNNAAATLIALKALTSEGEVIVSRGQLIEIGGSFRLPEVMAESGARLVEVGATNRTHLRDYQNAITEKTRAILRVHPSNYRVVGFTCEPHLQELVELAHRNELLLIDDLGAGALVDLRPFGLPREPTVQDSIQAGADLVLFSGDKLIGASQAGIIVGRRALIQRIRKHPLMRSVRVDKTCVMILERTLRLFRDPERLRETLPTFVMASTSLDQVKARAERLVELARRAWPNARFSVEPSQAYLGSGSLPTEAIPSVIVTVSADGMSADALSRSLRLDPASVFGRIESDRVCLDMRTVQDTELSAVAEALGRIAASCC